MKNLRKRHVEKSSPITFSFLETCLIDGMLMSFCPKNSHRLMINVNKSIRNIKDNLNWTEVSSSVLSLDSNEGMRHLQDTINSHLIFSRRYPFRIWMATKQVLTARKLKDFFRRKIRRSKYVHIKMECVNSIYYQNKLLARLKNMNDQKNIKDINVWFMSFGRSFE